MFCLNQTGRFGKKKKVNKMQLDVSVNRIKWTVKCHLPHHLPRHHLQPEKSACS